MTAQRILFPGELIITAHGEIHGESTPASIELARRVKACLNACDGISTEELEAGIVHDMARVLRQVAPLLEERVHGHQDGKAA